jgi:hypothetical protein
MPKRHLSPLKVRFVSFSVALLVLLPARAALAEEGAKKAETVTEFIRLQSSMKDEPTAFQTATVRFVPADGKGETVVDLIGVVHIGDREYYQKLNKQFESYDVLLYELVAAPKDQVPTREKVRQADGLIATLQKVGPMLLGLESQMDHIDYTKKNFVHADLSPAEMAKVIKERGDDAATIFLSAAADLLRQQNLERLNAKKESEDEADDSEQPKKTDPFQLLMSPNGGQVMKLALAKQLAGSDPTGGLGKTLGTILIDDRNAAAMKVFQKELAKGHKRIGIFYGAAHMPDFEKRLREDFGLKRKQVNWMTAWDLTKNKTSGPPINRLLKSLLE